jgi:beta-glucosidase
MSLTVTNTGTRRGTEVVQLYAADTATGVTLPAQQLIGFARVDLEPGASRTITFVLPMSHGDHKLEVGSWKFTSDSVPRAGD